ncbi:MAG: hypothetical protein Q7U04_03180 [Bacteriovorax sp.]|nr:hypothetical protein [Bacteriovorax sp.]
MKKIAPLLFSIFIALSIAIYNKRPSQQHTNKLTSNWKTFVKHSDQEITEHKSTSKEFEAARIPTLRRDIAQEKTENENDNHDNTQDQEKIIKDNHFLVREGRVLIGDIQKKNYQDEDVPLEMTNKISPNWKEILGAELLRFHDKDAKVMIKDEFSIIRIQNGKGHYLEQIIVTYVLKDGANSSYRALVDSETGAVMETWDKTIYENYKINKRTKLSLPSENSGGIIAR